MKNSHLFILFGATGDLAYKKILPALYNLDRQGLLGRNFRILGIGRRNLTQIEFRDYVKKSMMKYSRYDRHEEDRVSYLERVDYFSMDFNDKATYSLLCDKVREMEDAFDLTGNRFYYLATAPEYFGIIAKNLSSCTLIRQGENWTRVGIEKPFGHDLTSAEAINHQLHQAFDEKNIYRVDHYLGKSMVQKILALRFTNPIIHSLWCKEHIDHVQIQVKERDGIGSRGRYYDKSGALRDMVQSHLLQILALIGMEPPKRLDTESIRDEKVKILNSLHLFNHRDMPKESVFGQYTSGRNQPGYLEEDDVQERSVTETLAALKIRVDNDRWDGVPFYLLAAKAMDEKVAKVIIQFKSNEYVSSLYPLMMNQPNRLEIHIQPKEGASIFLNAHQWGEQDRLNNIELDYCQNCDIQNNSPQAYEVLLVDMLRGDQSMFARWDEIKASWTFVDRLNEACFHKQTLTYDYPAGSKGPMALDVLLERDGRRWW